MGSHIAAQGFDGAVAVALAMVVLLAALRRSRNEALVQGTLSDSLRPYLAVAGEVSEV